MRIVTASNYSEMSQKAADIIAAQIKLKPNSILGLATGSTPEGLYKRLAELYRAGELDFSGVTSINLDEYRGLSSDNDQSYAYYMKTNLFDHVNIKRENTNLPNGLADDSDAECSRYNEIISSSGGIDLQLLGIGPNGHIGFNEPADIFEDKTHCVKLTESTINANARFFERYEDVPKEAYTMGIGSIMRAGEVLLIASGRSKADIMRKALFGPVTPRVPASILQFHRNLTVVVDEEVFAAQ